MAISQYAIDNFWNRLRVERNIRYIDLLELFPSFKTHTSIGFWFSGQTMPKDEHISVLCDFFDVDFAKGKEEFRKAHENWESTHHQNKRVTTGKGETRDIANSGDGDARMAVRYEQEHEQEADIFELVYGKLPYDLFRKFIDLVAGQSKDDALRIIYSNVTYDEFRLIERVIKEG